MIHPVCLLIAGLPASGKSTLANQLSRELGMVCLSKDQIKESLFDTLGFSCRAEKVRLGEAAYRVMLDLARSMLLAGQNVLLENNFEDASLAPLLALLKETSAQPITVMLDGDTQAIYRRFVLREQSPSRHRGHVINTRYPEDADQPNIPPTFEAFARSIEQRGYRRFAVSGPRLNVDGSDLVQVDWPQVVQWVQRHLNP